MASLSFLDPWSECITRDVDLAPFTSLNIGGKAAADATPPSVKALSSILTACKKNNAPVRFLGSGTNILVRDEGWSGLVIRFSEPFFQTITVNGTTIQAKTGANLGLLVSTAARHNLSGLESLVGVPGTIGGALKNDLKIKTGPLSEFVSSVELLDPQGNISRHTKEDLPIEQLLHAPDGTIILSADFILNEDHPDVIVKRLRRQWIQTKSQYPLSFERAARLFRDPPGGTANQLIMQSGSQQAAAGGASLSERDANYVIVHDPVKAQDVIDLMGQVASQVEERVGQQLIPSLVVW
jgi:UDP-N-acetylmuramate dehydrogenase